MTERTLSAIAAEVAAEMREGDTAIPGGNLEEFAERIGRQIRLERPDVKPRSAVSAARRQLGIAAPDSPAPTVGGSGRARRGAGRAARRVARRASRGVVRSTAALTSQALGLLLLYWLLRNAGSVARLSDAVVDGLEWLTSTAPIGGEVKP
jgi:hypothetical protein